MAVHATHRTANFHSAPSIFEIVAQDSFNASLYPAFNHLIEALQLHNSKHFSFISKWNDELFLALNGFIQYYYLKVEGGSLSEAFYGLERISVSSGKLPPVKRLASLLTLVLAPYLKIKLEKLCEQYKIQDIEGHLRNNDTTTIIKRNIYQLEPVISFLLQCIKLLQYLRYISGKSLYSSLELQVLSLTLTHSQKQRLGLSWTEILGKASHLNFWFSRDLYKTFGQIMFRSLEVGAFFLQFLQWWYAKNLYTNITSVPVPSVPETMDMCERKLKGKCPICYQKWKIPTVLPVSGYVFCYRCIVRQLRETSSCPVTRYPAKVDDLIRLYEEN